MVKPRAFSQQLLSAKPAEHLMRDFELVERIGDGQYGDVYRCRELRTGEVFACKEIDLEHHGASASREAEALERAQGHPNVVALRGLYRDAESAFIVMEMCDRGTLLSRVCDTGGLCEDEARQVFRQLSSALKHCHDRGVVHRDIKPENIFLTGAGSGGACCAGGGAVRLGDFGLALLVPKGKKVRGIAGSPPYEAPEMLARRPYDHAVDVWSLGVVLYAMLSSRWPLFCSKTEILEEEKGGEETKFFNEEESFAVPVWSFVSDSAKNLIRRMLRADSTQRPTADELLRDPWVAQQPLSVALADALRAFREVSWASGAFDSPHVAPTLGQGQWPNCRPPCPSPFPFPAVDSPRVVVSASNGPRRGAAQQPVDHPARLMGSRGNKKNAADAGVVEGAMRREGESLGSGGGRGHSACSGAKQFEGDRAGGDLRGKGGARREGGGKLRLNRLNCDGGGDGTLSFLANNEKARHITRKSEVHHAALVLKLPPLPRSARLILTHSGSLSPSPQQATNGSGSSVHLQDLCPGQHSVQKQQNHKKRQQQQAQQQQIQQQQEHVNRLSSVSSSVGRGLLQMVSTAFGAASLQQATHEKAARVQNEATTVVQKSTASHAASVSVASTAASPRFSSRGVGATMHTSPWRQGAAAH